MIQDGSVERKSTGRDLGSDPIQETFCGGVYLRTGVRQ